jgi:two-component system phosphate regulon sensor histidine kinase PhoR
MPTLPRGILLALAGVAAVGLVGLLAVEAAGFPLLAGLPFLLIVTWLGYRLGAMDGQQDRQARDEGSFRMNSDVAADQIGIAALADPALIIGDDWRVVATNALVAGLFATRLEGADLRQAVRHPLVLEAVRETMEGAQGSVREATGLGQTEGVFRVRVVALADGRYLLTFTDITQARLTERMRVDFVANASHELRTPLANISGFIETLQGPAADDEPARHRFLDIMAREASRMSRLIDDLLSLSRIELDKYVRPQAPLDLPPLVADVGKTLAMRLEADGRRLIIDVADDLPQVVGDRDQILQVMHNLVSNALKYGYSGTPIRVRAGVVKDGPRGEEVVRISVEDEGEGIAPEHLPRLTERFYRVETGRSRSIGGTGLGLAIVKHIVERHRGRLDFSSHQGEGTKVSFTLPLAPAQPPRLVASDPPANPVGSHKSEMIS